MSTTTRQFWAALRLLAVLTVLFGVLYPAAIWGVGQVAFRTQAAGSLVRLDGKVVGSSLLGQNFTGAQWFHARPSASDYAGNTSGGSNLPESDKRLWTAVDQREKQDGSNAPADALTESASGLDPDISPAYAQQQIARVATARHLSVATVTALVHTYTSGRTLGFISEPRVNVTELNLALAQLPSS